ncbi:MAG TPA: 1,4-beta-xylanase [Dehalococcoidia bacterium]|nr:1,4-beta-xylanase [Dehalococcoidia bacterium]
MSDARWPIRRANDWYRRQPWLVGCNFIPSTAVNQLEMWQAETFDLETIDRELGWAEALGFNTARVFLHDLLWEADARGFAGRIDAFLGIARRHGIAVMFVLFDDCWNDGATLGPQPPPAPGRHNSRWLQSPGHTVAASGGARERLEAYVTGVVRAFGADARVLAWDLYNEVTNGLPPPWSEDPAARRRREEALPGHLELLELAFAWARAARPEQPLTAGLWSPDRELNARLVALSDIVTFHCYEGPERLETLIGRLKRHGRPVICTEYMARTLGSTFRGCLPVFQRERVGCYNWGLVNGKTQTHIAWTGEAEVWFHDIFRPDGSPYDPDEVAFIRELTRAGRERRA